MKIKVIILYALISSLSAKEYNICVGRLMHLDFSESYAKSKCQSEKNSELFSKCAYRLDQKKFDSLLILNTCSEHNSENFVNCVVFLSERSSLDQYEKIRLCKKKNIQDNPLQFVKCYFHFNQNVIKTCENAL